MRSPTVHRRRATTVEPQHSSPVLRCIGLAWSLITLALLAIMLVLFAYGAMDLIVHHD